MASLQEERNEYFQGIKGVVQIGTDLYVKTPEALESLFSVLRESYTIKDCGQDKYNPCPGNWHARILDSILTRKGKCGSCGAYIDNFGIATHKHQCEACGAYTFLEFVDGTEISFTFISPNSRPFEPSLNMEVREYRDDEKLLLLYSKPIASSHRFSDLSANESMEVLKENQDKFSYVQEGGISLIAIKYDHGGEEENICIHNIFGKKRNYKIVMLCGGKEYGEFDEVPVVRSYSINEAWHWAPLKTSPTLHEKIIGAANMPSNCDYYYQDGRIEFGSSQLERMRIFVQHFTELDLAKWDIMICLADKSGPGMIRAVAAFCHPNPEIRDEPNIGNALYGFGKVLCGDSLTKDERREMRAAISDPEQGGILCNFFRSISNRRK